ncbi:MAG: zinc-binding dehydrogenase [Acidimicrobiales bacterium]
MSEQQTDQTWSYLDFRSGNTPLPEPNLAWNTYGTGLEAIGVDGKPEPVEIPAPAGDQLLIRVDAVGLCFSDVKLLKQGGDHPKLYGRDLKVEPTRLGHEVAVTVIAVGDDLAGTYEPGQRLAIQPDIYVNGRAEAYGYTTPGGLIQYHLIGAEVLDADHGAYVIPVGDDIGYAAAALSEPWACVEASYTQRRRLEPAVGGTMWVIGSVSDSTVYTSSAGLGSPSTIVLSDASDTVRALVDQHRPADSTVVDRNGLTPADVARIASEQTGEDGFDDIIVLGQTGAALVEEVAKVIAFRGTMTMVGTRPLDGDPQIDVGRIHYHYTAFLGTSSADISTAWGEERNRADVKPHGTAVYVGAGGPMGQMHMQRAIETPDGPTTIIGIDLDDDRIETARTMLASLAEERGRRFILINPGNDQDAAAELVAAETDGVGADDVIVTVPVGAVMGDAAKLMAPDGMLVLFAGVPNGTMAPLDMSKVYLQNAQYTGTSGSSIEDQASVLAKASAGALSPGRALAAVGGIEAGRDGVQALLEGHYAGKVVIFPQLTGLELTGLDDLARQHPEIAGALGENNTWTSEAERLLFEAYHAS